MSFYPRSVRTNSRPSSAATGANRQELATDAGISPVARAEALARQVSVARRAIISDLRPTSVPRSSQAVTLQDKLLALAESGQPAPVKQRFPTPAYLKASNFYASLITNNGPSGNPSEDQNRILLPTRWDPKRCCELLELSNDGLTVQFRGSGKNGDKPAGAVRSDRPMPVQSGVYYFEVEILSKGQSGTIGVGFSGPDVALTSQPGWEDSSYGFHGDDGQFYPAQGTGGPSGPTFTTEDVIGCGIDWTTRRGFFTKNGSFINFCFAGLQGELYPSVGMRSPGEVVQVNFGQTPFRFDIVDFVKSCQTAFYKSLADKPIPSRYLDDVDELAIDDDKLFQASQEVLSLAAPSTTATLISDYLTFHGYADTLLSFQQEREERAKSCDDIQPAQPQSRIARAGHIALPKREVESHGSIAARRRLSQLIVDGDARSALAELRESYPEVIEADKSRCLAQPHLSDVFQLRCQEFVQFMLSARSTAESDISMDVDEQVQEALTKTPLKIEPVELEEEDDELLEANLEEALHLGQSLHNDYHTSSSPNIQSMLHRIFSLWAYSSLDDREDGELQRILDELRKSRIELGRSVNAHILASRGGKSTSALELVYRQNSVLIQQLGDRNDGQAAFASVCGDE